jgi:DNA repair protein RadC
LIIPGEESTCTKSKVGDFMKRVNFYSTKLVKEKTGLYDLENIIIHSPEDGAMAIRVLLTMEEEPAERFGIFTLNTKNKIIGVHVLFKGTLNASVVHPREVFQAALLNNAASIICWHNHPSGDPTPSREDIDVTKRLVECGKLIGIDLLDHIIMGDPTFVSLKEKGYL